jgi:hypothetical protein
MFSRDETLDSEACGFGEQHHREAKYGRVSFQNGAPGQRRRIPIDTDKESSDGLLSPIVTATVTDSLRA